MTRKEKRNIRAELVCREVRTQMVKGGGIYDNAKLFNLLLNYMKVATKDIYKPVK